MKIFTENLFKYLERSDTLKYIKIIDLCSDPGQLVDSGKFPFISLEPDSKSVSDIKDFHKDDGNTNIYKIIISFATSHTKKKTSIMGTTDFKGIFDIANDINTTIEAYIESVKYAEHISIHEKPIVYQRTWQSKSSKYISGSELIIEFKQDDFE